jgi:tRNA-specific 2-thiouridylase
MFPVGHLLKADVRRLAREAGLPNHAKRDSTGICFIGERPFREFLSRYLPKQPGPMTTPEGERVGEHQGLMYYTIGQRQGLGIGGRREGEGDPWYVAGKDLGANTLIVVQGHDHALLLKRQLAAADASWIAGAAPGAGAFAAKTRYRQADSECELVPSGERAFELEFPAPQWAVTPGQSAVLYRGDECLESSTSPAARSPLRSVGKPRAGAFVPRGVNSLAPTPHARTAGITSLGDRW